MSVNEYFTVAENQDFSELVAAAQNTACTTLHFRTVGQVAKNLKEKFYRCTIAQVDAIYDDYCDKQSSQNFIEFRRQYAPLPKAANTSKEIWNMHAMEVAKAIRVGFKLGYSLDANGYILPQASGQRLEDFFNAVGIVLVVVPHSREFGHIQGFADCYLGMPVLVLKQVKPQDYRSMFYTAAHELFHLLYGEGEYIGNGPFAGTLLLGKQEYIAEYQKITDRFGQNNHASEYFAKAMPQLLRKFPFYSAACLANTACNYGIIADEERKKWQKGHEITAYYREADSMAPVIQPYVWQPNNVF